MSTADSDSDSEPSPGLTRRFQSLMGSNMSRDNEELLDKQALKILQALPGFDGTCLYKCTFITPKDEVHSYIMTYVSNSQDHGFHIDVLNILRVVRDGDYEFNHDPKKKNRFRMMLWHGTKKEAVPNILKNGFRKPIAKGQMFGSGIYFADRCSKSARYCFGNPPPTDPPKNDIAYMLLCDVLVGKAYNAKNAHNDYETAPVTTKRQFDSVKCTGEMVPDRATQIEFEGVKWPVGKSIKNDGYSSYAVRFNEFIVYDPDNVKIKYVVKVKFS